MHPYQPSTTTQPTLLIQIFRSFPLNTTTYKMLSLFQLSLALLAATQLAAAQAPTTKVATELSRRDNGCALSGVVNGQCGRFYSGAGCNDMITQINPDVSVQQLLFFFLFYSC